MWHQLMINLSLEQERQIGVSFLREIGFDDADHKLPPATPEQLQCRHRNPKRFGSQWCLMHVCRMCYRRASYMPTAQAVEALNSRDKRTREKKA